MVMARLWSTWKNPVASEEIACRTVLTCAPNEVMAELHDCMPVILGEADWAKWVGEEPATNKQLLDLLTACLDGG